MEKSKKNKLVFIFIFLVICIALELLTRNLLNEESIIIEKYLQKKYRKLVEYLKIFPNLNYFQGIPFTFVIAFLLFPLTYSYSFLFCFILSVYINSLLKMIYSDSRPYLEDKSLFQVFKTGYGNPSGHSFVSTTCYFSLVQEFIDFYKLGSAPSITIYAITTLIILGINFSRILLGIHSINQVIYGDCLGFSLYYLFFQALEIHKRNINKFFNNFLNIKRTIKFSIGFVISILLLMVVNSISSGQNDLNAMKYKNIISELSPQLDPYRMFNFNSFSGGLLIFEYFGMFYGFVFLVNLIKNDYSNKYEEINNYFHNTETSWIKYICLLSCFPPLIIYFFIPNTVNIYVILIIKQILPIFTLMFFLYGVNIYFCIMFKGANKNIYDNILPMEENDYRLMEDESNFEKNTDISNNYESLLS